MNSRARGFSLIELIFFIVIVSVGLAGVLQVLQVTTGASADPMVRKQALALAESVLQEVVQKAYTDPRDKKGDFPVTEHLCAHVISLPMHTELGADDLRYITESVLEFVTKS